MATPENTAVADAVEIQRKKTFDRNKWLFSAGGIGRDMAYQLIASFLLVYIQFSVSLTLVQFTTISLVIGVGGRIWDAINDPFMGAIIEGSHMKWGKFKPWIFFGAITCGAVIIAMFNIQSLSGWNFVIFMCVMYLLWESTFTMNDIGYWAMLPSLSSVTKERNQVTTFTVLFAGVGAIIAQGLIPTLTTGDMRAGYRMVSIAVVVVFILCQTMTSFGVRETPRQAAEEGDKVSLKKVWKTIKNNDQILWMTLSQLFYNVGSALLVALAANLLYSEVSYDGGLYFYIVVAYGVPSVFVNAIYPWLVGKLGRKKLQLFSIIAAIVGYIAIGLMGWTSFFPFSIVPLCVFVVLISCGQSLFYMASIVNMTNCVEYNDYKQGERNEAVVSTLRPFMAKFGAAVQTLVVTIALTVSGVYMLSQSVSALEIQRDFFAKIEEPASQVYYIEKMQNYIAEFAGVEEGTERYAAVAASVADAIDRDEKMRTYQINAEYIPALADAMVVATYPDGRVVELGRLSSVPRLAASGATYSLDIDYIESGESAANLHFRDRITTRMRIFLRCTVAGLPIVLLLVSLFIQRKKFIIDEKYYDMMVAEIAARDNK